MFSICPVINGVGERHVSLFFSWKPQARSRRSCTVPIRQIFTEWLTFLCFNLITLFWVGRNSNDVTWCDRAFYAKIHNFRPSISLYLWNANRNSHTSLQDLQIVSGSLSEKKYSIYLYDLASCVSYYFYCRVRPEWLFKVILGHVSFLTFRRPMVISSWMMPVVPCTAACNGLHLAHLRWFKGTQLGAINNLKPNMLEAAWERRGYFTRRRRRQFLMGLGVAGYCLQCSLSNKSALQTDKSALYRQRSQRSVTDIPGE